MGPADKPKAAFAHHSRTKRKELLIYPPSNRKDYQPVQVIGCGITWLAIEPRLSNAARNRTNRSFFRISILELGFAASIHPTASIGAFLINSFHSRADSGSRGEQVPTPLKSAIGHHWSAHPLRFCCLLAAGLPAAIASAPLD